MTNEEQLELEIGMRCAECADKMSMEIRQLGHVTENTLDETIAVLDFISIQVAERTGLPFLKDRPREKIGVDKPSPTVFNGSGRA